MRHEAVLSNSKMTNLAPPGTKTAAKGRGCTSDCGVDNKISVADSWLQADSAARNRLSAARNRLQLWFEILRRLLAQRRLRCRLGVCWGARHGKQYWSCSRMQVFNFARASSKNGYRWQWWGRKAPVQYPTANPIGTIKKGGETPSSCTIGFAVGAMRFYITLPLKQLATLRARPVGGGTS